MARRGWQVAAWPGAGIIVIVVGALVASWLFAQPHPGEAHYDAYCGECHSRGGVISMLSRRPGAAERLLAEPHIRRHVSDPGEHAHLIAYLRREMGG